MPLNSFNTLDEIISKQIQTFEKDNYIISVCSECADEKYGRVLKNADTTT